MPKFHVHMQAYASTTITVEAEDYNEAIEKAYNEGTLAGLCAQCAGWGQEHSLNLSEFDVNLVTDENSVVVWEEKSY